MDHGVRLQTFWNCGGHGSEDAVQTAFIRLYGVWSQVSPESCDRYVRRIVTNVLVDEHRRGWFRRERATDVLPDRTVPDASQRSVETMAVLAALARLPRRQRAVVVLRYWEDLSVEQVSDILRCSTGTVKSQASRGLATLRELLADTPPDHSVPQRSLAPPSVPPPSMPQQSLPQRSLGASS